MADKGTEVVMKETFHGNRENAPDSRRIAERDAPCRNKKQNGWRKGVRRTENRSVSLDSPLEGGRGWMRPCSYMRSSLCPGDDPLFFVLRHHFTEMREKKRWIQTNWRTAHCTLTMAPRQSTCTMNQPPFFETPAGSAGGRGGRAAETGRGK